MLEKRIEDLVCQNQVMLFYLEKLEKGKDCLLEKERELLKKIKYYEEKVMMMAKEL